MRLARDVGLLNDLRQAGQQEAKQRFSVVASAAASRSWIQSAVLAKTKTTVF